MDGRKLKSLGKLGSCNSGKQTLSDRMPGVGLPGKRPACRMGKRGSAYIARPGVKRLLYCF